MGLQSGYRLLQTPTGNEKMEARKKQGLHLKKYSCELFLNGNGGGRLKTKAQENIIRSQDSQKAQGYRGDNGASVLGVELLWVYGPHAGKGPPAPLCLQAVRRGERGRSLLPSVIKAENRRLDPQMARAQKLDLVMRLLSES